MRTISIKSIMAQAAEVSGRRTEGRSKRGARRSFFEFRRKIGTGGRLSLGIAAWLVWREGGWRRQRGVLTLFVLQLVVNVLWSWLFFAWHHGSLAFADIVLLWLLLAATVTGFWRVRPLAGALLLPYLCWVGFALALNYAVWQLNPETLGLVCADQGPGSPVRVGFVEKLIDS